APAPAPAQGRERSATRDRAPARTAARCSDCGVVQSVREVDVKGQGSGLGAVGGAVVGGVLGNQVGGGRGKDVMTVVGAVGGAVAGNEVEKRVKSTKSYETTVRFDDGTSRAISEANAPSWRAGDKVRVVNGVIRSDG
ncbi:MAG: glycine zipper 2TM domain-containing protein, partial [Burkholderiales bacterium]